MQNNINKELNFVFFGTPEVASETLEILKQAGFLASLIVTSQDKPKGRKMLVTPPAVKVWAMENKTPYIQPEKLGTELFKNNPDLFIVVAYGKIIPEEILNMPKLGSINIHYSLLPKYRGASPVESAILNGDMETGVSIQQMEYKMDTGPIVLQKKTNILPDEKAPDLRKRLIKIGGELLVKILKTPSADGHSPFAGGEEQDESQATFCKKIKKEDGLLDLNDNPIKNYNKFRAYAFWPRTFFFARRSLGEGGFSNKRITITKARLENGQFIIEKIIPENGKEVDYRD